MAGLPVPRTTGPLDSGPLSHPGRPWQHPRCPVIRNPARSPRVKALPTGRATARPARSSCVIFAFDRGREGVESGRKLRLLRWREYVEEERHGESRLGASAPTTAAPPAGVSSSSVARRSAGCGRRRIRLSASRASATVMTLPSEDADLVGEVVHTSRSIEAQDLEHPKSRVGERALGTFVDPSREDLGKPHGLFEQFSAR